MGRILKKILAGAGLAVAIFLAVVYFFGERNTISVGTLTAAADQALAGMGAGALTEQNLTKNLSEKCADPVLQGNPEGPQADDGSFTLDIENPEELVAKAIAAQEGNFNPDDFIYEISEARLHLGGV